MPTDITDILRDLETLLEDGEKIEKTEVFSSGEKREQAPRTYITTHTDKRALFVKSARDSISQESFRKEYETLLRLRLKAFQTPRPFGLFDWGIVMLGLNGTFLDKRIGDEPISSELRSLLERVVLCISSFHSSTQKKVADSKSLEKTYRELTGKDSMSSEYVDALKLASIGFTHGDLDPFNLLVTDTPNHEFALIDWEDFREDGIQELDIIHFVIMLAVINNSNISHDELHEIVFNPEGLFVDLLRIYCNERQISISIIQQLIPLYCDVQNFRLIKANRGVDGFLYNTFRKHFYDL